MKIKIIGQAITQFGELWSWSLEDLLSEAMTKALTDANLEPQSIEAIFVANMSAGMMENQVHLGALASQILSQLPGYTVGRGSKRQPAPAFRIEGACASGSLALLVAEHALLAKQYQTVLVVGVEKMTDVEGDLATRYLAGAAHFAQEYGSTFPGLYALLTQAHQQQYGTTREQLSSVAVKNHRHAFDNPTAQYHKQLTLDQVSQSQLVADPLRLLDCSPLTDGAAAVILTTKDLKNQVEVAGFGHGQDSLDLAHRSSLTSLAATQAAAQAAYQMAGLTAANIQVAEVHDCFTIGEILACEDLGLVAAGQGGPTTLSGQTTHGGQIVINPSGGLKAGGHPVGATGIKQVAYLTKLLRADQFATGLAHNVGGSGATSVVHLLTKKYA